MAENSKIDVPADWMKWLTNKDSGHEFLKRPFGIRGMVAATDGRACVIVAPHLAGDFAGAVENELGVEKVGKLLDSQATFLADLPESFKELLGPPELTTYRDCFECNGTGHGRCRECSHACQCICDNCDGSGEGCDYPEARPAFLGENCIDRNLLAKAVAGLPFDGGVKACAGREPFSNNPMLRFEGQQWTVFLMPMQDPTESLLPSRHVTHRWNGAGWDEFPAEATPPVIHFTEDSAGNLLVDEVANP